MEEGIGLLHASFEASLSLLGRQQLMTSHLARAGGTEAIDKYQLIAITGNHHFAIEKCVYIYIYTYIYISGWWYTYPSEKYESQMWWLFPIYIYTWENKKCSKPPTKFILYIIILFWCFVDFLELIRFLRVQLLWSTRGGYTWTCVYHQHESSEDCQHVHCPWPCLRNRITWDHRKKPTGFAGKRWPPCVPSTFAPSRSRRLTSQAARILPHGVPAPFALPWEIDTQIPYIQRQKKHGFLRGAPKSKYDCMTHHVLHKKVQIGHTQILHIDPSC